MERHPLTNIVPPVHLLITMVVMFLLNLFLPLAPLFPDSWDWFGKLIVLIGFSGVFYAAKFFKRARTPLRPFEPVKSMITTGPFRFSRNPVYLFMFVLLVGWAISLGSLSPWFGVFWFIYIIRNYWIPAEEAQMEREMGAAYQEYKARVRRWF